MRKKESLREGFFFGGALREAGWSGGEGGANEDVISSGYPLSLIPPGALEHESYESCRSMRQGGTFVMPCLLVIAQVCGGQSDL